MDEINEKAIKDIIDYYDSVKKDVPDESLENTAPSLVDIVEEAQKKSENTSESVENAETEESGESYGEGNAESTEEKSSSEAEASDELDGAEEFAEKSAEAQTENAAVREESETDAESVSEAAAEKNAEENGDTEKARDETAADEKPRLAITPVYDLAEIEAEEAEAAKKPKKRVFIAAAIIIAAVIVLFVTVDTGFIGTYKKNASKNIAWILDKTGIDFSKSGSEDETAKTEVKKAASRETAAKSSVSLPMENAGKSVFAKYRGGAVCAYTNYLAFISAEGEKIWETATTVVNPLIEAAGNYILIAENGGTKLCLYNDSRLVYETETEDNILTCSVSSNGDVVAVCDKSAYKGALAVYNKDGRQVFAWSSGSDNIISADISASSRRVAAALLNTDETVKTTVQLFDLNKTESFAQIIFEDTIIFDVSFSGDTVNLVGDNCIAGMTSGGELIYDKRFDDAELVHYAADKAGNKILIFDNSNLPLINIYNSGAELKNQLTSDEIPEFADICGKYIVYNSGRDILYGKAGKRQLAKYTASMDIKELMLLDEDTFIIVYSNNIETVGM